MSGPPATDLSELLRLAARRDEAAARAFVETMGPLVLRLIHSHHVLRDEADDLLQDIFFAVFRSAGKYRGEAPVEHWVARIARCTCIDRLRRKRARIAEVRWSDLPHAQQAILSDAAMQDESPPVSHGEDAAALLERLFALIPPLDAWLLREVELRERSPADVAAEAGWSAVLLRVRLFRARRRLQAALENLQRTRL